MIAAFVIMFVLFAAVFALVVIYDHRERRSLVEMLAAKDYTDYKSFENPPVRESRKDMFKAREAKIKERDKLEREGLG